MSDAAKPKTLYLTKDSRSRCFNTKDRCSQCSNTKDNRSRRSNTKDRRSNTRDRRSNTKDSRSRHSNTKDRRSNTRDRRFNTKDSRVRGILTLRKGIVVLTLRIVVPGILFNSIQFNLDFTDRINRKRGVVKSGNNK